MTRRPEIPGIAQSGRNDQFAGFLLGAAKGLLIAAFVTAGIQKYAMEPIKTVTWAEEQVKTSWALQWSEAYQPVPRIWSSRPVRHFVNHIERMGLRKPGERSQSPAGEEDDGEGPPVRTASRPSRSWKSRADARRSAGPDSLVPPTASTREPLAARLSRRSSQRDSSRARTIGL